MIDAGIVEGRLLRRPTFADRAFGESLAGDAALVTGLALVTALAAQVQVHLWFTPVPITGQTFAFLLTGLVAGSRRGLLSQLLYVAMGVLGLPFFAGGSHGAAVVFGASGGYLFGGILAAYVVGVLAERGLDRKPGTAFLAMVAGEVAIYALGLANLARFVPLHALLVEGFLPFLPGDLVKMLLVAGLLPMAWKLVGERPTVDSAGS